MKTTLMMAITANGMVADKNDDTPWSEDEFANFERCVAQHGNLIIGRRTFDMMHDAGALDFARSATVIVVSSNKLKEEGFVHTSSPQQALIILAERGFTTAMVGGGTGLNTSFLDAGLIDELILDIEPWLFGDGLPLLNKIPAEIRLSLLSTQKLNDDTLSLHYKIIKS